jgi:hypothetical protein
LIQAWQFNLSGKPGRAAGKNRCPVESKRGTIERVKRYWEIIADNLSKAGWSWGIVSAIDCEGRTIWAADAHRDDGKRYVVHADDKLTAFLELEIGDSRRREARIAQLFPKCAERGATEPAGMLVESPGL